MQEKNNPIFSSYRFRDISYFSVVSANNKTVKHTIDLKSKVFYAIKPFKKTYSHYGMVPHQQNKKQGTMPVLLT